MFELKEKIRQILSFPKQIATSFQVKMLIIWIIAFK